MKHEEYLAAVRAYVQSDNAALERFVENLNHSRCEIGLIRARQEIKRGEYDVAFERLCSLQPESTLLKAEIHFVRSNLQSYRSLWQEAALDAQIAIEAYTVCQYARGLFIANYNLSVYYNRLGLDLLSRNALERCLPFVRDVNQTVLVLRAQACESSRLGLYQRAVEQIEKALSHRLEIDPVDASSLDAVAADLYFRAEKFSQALDCLERQSQSKVIRDRARIRFEITLMRAIRDKAERFVEGPMPESVFENIEYQMRWKIIESLQDGDLAASRKRWQALSHLFPQRFAAGFQTVNSSDEKTTFMFAVRSLLTAAANQRPQIQSADLKGKMGELVSILLESPLYLRKEELIERLWETSYDPVFDNRFYKLVGRLRQSTNIQIDVVANTYRLRERAKL